MIKTTAMLVVSNRPRPGDASVHLLQGAAGDLKVFAEALDCVAGCEGKTTCDESECDDVAAQCSCSIVGLRTAVCSRPHSTRMNERQRARFGCVA
ncbi:hypothetical protein NOVOSPHI9U_310010 [Novosphingobium sp. 9U]|nr:hypothetical protein NOVOSPHI9U_310010 [Novosphingobium sp. 9U]